MWDIVTANVQCDDPSWEEQEFLPVEASFKRAVQSVRYGLLWCPAGYYCEKFAKPAFWYGTSLVQSLPAEASVHLAPHLYNAYSLRRWISTKTIQGHLNLRYAGRMLRRYDPCGCSG